MVWLDIALGAIVSLAFILAGVLYLWSKEEVDNLFSRLRVNKFISWITAVIAGVILAFAVTTSWKDMFSLCLFFFILVLGSIAFARTDKKFVIKYSIISAVLFFISFAAIYALRI